ncbi:MULTISPECIES: UDP-galactopyranose mutase [unclassified Adlercreutzia]|uniref:UDP-galactopyranose mutase n=1 Tax=unclassified Adlercreutzia TaxID=2636013 RepID=UPI0013EBA823|nr:MULTISPECIES: UDP-galactopyranose mutase [unclassified Adlercreutzia]
MTQYDYLVVGAGLTGAVFAERARAAGRKCLVIDRRDHIAGNCYTESVRGINVHRYGAHIFHTSDRGVWDYVNRFAEFNSYVNCPVADYHGRMYNLPFNMNTFAQMWGVRTPAEARAVIERQRAEAAIEGEPRNLEEQALSLVGRDIFEKLVKEYTEKQWGCSCAELPPSIIKRLPVRYVYDNNYFNDRWQGIPVGGYTKMVAAMLDGVEVLTGVEYRDFAAANPGAAGRVVYTGPIDEYFGFRLGELEWRTVRFETELLEGVENWQGNAVVNYTSHDEPFTRIIEHKWFEFGRDEAGEMLPDTVISREYSSAWKPGDEPYYPINDEKNNALFERYWELGQAEEGVVFAGRLGAYRYYDMAPCIAAALDLAERELSE